MFPSPEPIARWRLYRGRSRLPDAASPDLRARSYTVAVELERPTEQDEGVLISHGDSNGGYALRIADGLLVHHYVHAGEHTVTTSTLRVPTGRRLGVEARVTRVEAAGKVQLVIDGRDAGSGTIPALARARTGYTGVDIGCDRGLSVGGYPSPASFTGSLWYVDIVAADDQWLDEAAVMEIETGSG